MSKIKSDESLKSKIRHLAEEQGLRPQEVLQMYIFGHLLMRLANSPYADRFVLKGGLLVSSMTGIFQRTTMDMDMTVIGMAMDERYVADVLAVICNVDVGDGMSFELERIESIREDDEYANWRAHIRVKYGRINAPVKVDITTGDAIYPPQVRHSLDLMLDQGTINVLSYHPTTVLAEKLETVLHRGEANTRARDFYDLYVIPRYSAQVISGDDIHEALLRTSGKRGSRSFIARWRDTLDDLRKSSIMHQVWNSYRAETPYAKEITFEETLDSIAALMVSAGF